MSVIKVSDFKEFPACDVLGYSLDFTTASPLDIKTVGVQNSLVLKIHTDHGSYSRSSRLSREVAELSSTKLMKTQENLKWASVWSEFRALSPSVNMVPQGGSSTMCRGASALSTSTAAMETM